MNLFVDTETRSTVDLRKTGVYVYAEHPSTEITMVAWALDPAGPVSVWIPPRSTECRTDYIDDWLDLGGGHRARMVGGGIPKELASLFADPAVRIVAHNAAFERIVMGGPAGRRIGIQIDPADLSRWDCTAARAAHLGLPRTLEGAAAALGLDIQKDKAGHALMLRMCKPRKPRKGEPPDAILWHESLAEITAEAAYCARDVLAEIGIWQVLPDLPPVERATWELTERMNDAGLPVDVNLLGAMLHVIEDAEGALNRDISVATGGAVPRVSDHMALTRWLTAQGLDDAADDGVGKAAVAAMLENTALDPLVRNVLALRRDGGGTSSKKYRSILQRLSADGRIRGVLVYCGAAATGRWSSRGAQLQNLSRGGQIKDDGGEPVSALHMVRDILGGATADEIECVYGPALVVAAECLRPLFTAPDSDHWLVRGDYSQIEARVNPWLAGAAWKLDAFRRYDAGTGPDLYRVAAAGIFRVPVADVTKAQRQIGKVGELALGFQGGQGAFQAMARAYGVKVGDEQAEGIKLAWREANPEIVGLWRGLNDAAIRCMRAPIGDTTPIYTLDGQYMPMHETPLTFRRSRAALTMRLPSGRRLVYWSARLRDVATPWGKRPAVIYRSEDSVTKRWSEFVGYGGLFCENAVQATARDLMADALLRMPAAGMTPLLTVHDEGVCAASRTRFPTAADAAQAIEAVMRRSPSWAAGLPVAADASAAERYVKG